MKSGARAKDEAEIIALDVGSALFGSVKNESSSYQASTDPVDRSLQIS